MKNVNDTGRRTEQEEDKAVLGRLKFLVLNLEMFVCCQRQEYAKLINCHIFRSEERKKKNIKFITRYISLERERDPQMSDLRVQCFGQVVQIEREFYFIFQIRISVEWKMICLITIQLETDFKLFCWDVLIELKRNVKCEDLKCVKISIK